MIECLSTLYKALDGVILRREREKEKRYWILKTYPEGLEIQSDGSALTYQV